MDGGRLYQHCSCGKEKGVRLIFREIKKFINSEVWPLIMIGFISVILYCNIFPNDFCIDDNLFIVDWPMIQNLRNWPMFFSSISQPIGEEGVYSPFKTVIHSLNYNLFGLSVWGYHVFSIILHLVGSLFAYWISFQLAENRSVAFLSALIFVVHPVHVESITSMTGSVDTLGVVLFFIAFNYYIKFRKGDFWGYICAVIFSLLAIFTHELVIVLPLLFLWYDFCFSGNISWYKKIRDLSPFFLIAFVYVVLKHIVLGSVTRGGYLYGSFYLTMLVSLKAFLKYVLTCFVPLQLSINPELSPGIFSVDWQFFNRTAVLSQSILDIQVLFALIIIVVFFFLLVRFYNRDRLISFGIGFFILSLLPVLNIIPLESYYAERYLYPASLGFSLCLASGVFVLLQKFSYGRHWIIFGFICLMVFYAGRTFLRNLDWRSEESLYYAESIWNPHHPIMLRNLGVIYLRQGRLEEAQKALGRADKLREGDRDILFALGEVLAHKKHFNQAISYYEKAILADKDFAEAYYNIAGIYKFWGDEKKSKKYLDASLSIYKKQSDFESVEKLFSNFTKY